MNEQSKLDEILSEMKTAVEITESNSYGNLDISYVKDWLSRIPAASESEVQRRNSILMNDVQQLCNLICNSPPSTIIEGRIESLALSIAHHSSVLNSTHPQAQLQDAERYRILRSAEKHKSLDLWEQGESEFDATLKQGEELDKELDKIIARLNRQPAGR